MISLKMLLFLRIEIQTSTFQVIKMYQLKTIVYIQTYKVCISNIKSLLYFIINRTICINYEMSMDEY